MARRKKTEQQEREQLSKLDAKHPADRTEAEKVEYEVLRQKYG